MNRNTLLATVIAFLILAGCFSSFGTVTVATNMAGRGTAILLEPGLADKLNERHLQLTEDSLENDGSGNQALEHSLGLRVIGTELNDLSYSCWKPGFCCLCSLRYVSDAMPICEIV